MKQLEPFAIYLFQEDNVLYGVARAKTDEVDSNYGYGFELVEDKNSKLNSAANIMRRARRSVVAQLSNTLNAILLYGDDVLDEDGNVNWADFKIEEYKRIKKSIKKGNVGFLNTLKGKKLEDKIIETLDKDRERFEKKNRLHTFKVQEITLDFAKKNKLI